MTFDEDYDYDYGYPTQATIDLPISTFGGGSQNWVDELTWEPKIIGIDPLTGHQIYEGDCCFVGFNQSYCEIATLDNIPF